MTKAPSDLRIKKIVPANLQHLLEVREKKQKDIQEATDIPISTLNSYFIGTHLPSAGNLQKIADYFGVKKSDIDPRYAPRNFLAESINEIDLYKILKNGTNVYYKGTLLDDDFFNMLIKQAQYYVEAQKYKTLEQKKK